MEELTFLEQFIKTNPAVVFVLFIFIVLVRELFGLLREIQNKKRNGQESLAVGGDMADIKAQLLNMAATASSGAWQNMPAWQNLIREFEKIEEIAVANNNLMKGISERMDRVLTDQRTILETVSRINFREVIKAEQKPPPGKS